VLRGLTGDWVGQGGAGVLAAPAATLHLLGTAGKAEVTATDPAGDDWTAIFTAPLGEQLHVGTYTGALRPGWQRGTTAPGLDVFGNGRGCNQTYGEFTITAIGWDSTGRLTALKASFTQHCEQPSRPPMTGLVEFGFPLPVLSLLSSILDPIPGQPVTLTATVLAPFGALRRDVTFATGSGTLGQGSLDGAGRAVLTTSFPAGTSSVTCIYPGDPVNDAGSASPLTIRVRYPSRTELSVVPPTGVYPLPVVLVADVLAASDQPSGTVTFLDNGVPIGTGTLVAGRSALSSTLPVGEHQLVARYDGDDKNHPSVSLPQRVTVVSP
jgi:hypothetical protein